MKNNVKNMKGSRFCKAYTAKVVVSPWNDMTYNAYLAAAARKDWAEVDRLGRQLGLRK